ncbi:putative zinc finger protein [Orchesella cincta]|uniref:Putative zinc finger protein n=1 Tax=Orchesella cincta TaxID=48709 RepID=A0A1D2MK64_ORCCI|nr:putative zinc finger protein [Orchesella cincta]
MEVYHRKTTTPPYTCPICARPFFRAGSIKSHIWSHYSEQDKAEVVARGRKASKIILQKDFPCDQCFRAFATSSGLEKHVSEQHREENGEKELCGLCGARVSNVKRHMSFKHVAEEDKRFECAICKKRFLLNCRLIKHRKLAHSNEKPWKCNVCAREFKVERYLKEHMRGHENVKPFTCHICDGFRLAYVLRRHVANIHEGKLRADQKKSKKQLMKFEDV